MCPLVKGDVLCEKQARLLRILPIPKALLHTVDVNLERALKV